MHSSDSALAERARRGDQEAFSVLVEENQGKVYNLALRLTGSAEDAADVAQEAFLNAWRGLPSFQGGCAFSTWLYRLTHNAAIDFLRRRSRQQGSDLSLDGDERGLDNLIPDPAPTPQQQVERQELQAALSEGLAKLSPEYRQALSLRLAGLSYAEIAQTLDVEEGTVKSRIARARLNLRNFLRETGNLPAAAASKETERR